MTLDNGQCADPRCPWCAKLFFKWLKSRMTQMATPPKGELSSFADAAATSIRA